MKRRYIKYILVMSWLAGAALTISAQGHAAQSNSLVCQDLIQRGKGYYDAKDYANAIHEFSKVLLVDPANAEAREFLEKMGISGSFYGHPNRRLAVIAQLSSDVAQYQNDIAFLEEEREKTQKLLQSVQGELQKRKRSFQEVISKQEMEQQVLRKDLKALHAETEARAAQNQATIRKFEKTVQKQSRKIVGLNTDLYAYKDRLTKKLGELKEKNGQLQQLEQQFKEADKDVRASEREWREETLDYENKLMALEQELDKYKDAVSQADIEKRERIKALKDDLREKMLELGHLRDKVIFSEYKLTHRDSQLAYRDQRIKELRAALTDIEKELPQVTASSSPGMEPGDPARLSVEREKAEFMKRQDRLIADLKERLIDADREMAVLREKGGGENQGRIADLQRQIQDMERQILQREDDLQKRDGDFQILEQRLQDTQQRLEFVQDVMQDKEREIRELEEQLNGVLSQF